MTREHLLLTTGLVCPQKIQSACNMWKCVKKLVCVYVFDPQFQIGHEKPPHKSCPEHEMQTPPKFNIEPENDDLEDAVPFPGCIVRFHVFRFRGFPKPRQTPSSEALHPPQKPFVGIIFQGVQQRRISSQQYLCNIYCSLDLYCI